METLRESESGNVVEQLAVGVVAVGEVVVVTPDAVEREVARLIAINQIPDMFWGDAVGIAILDGEVEECGGVTVVRGEGTIGEYGQVIHLRPEGKVGAVTGGPGFTVGGIEGVVMIVKATEPYVGTVDEPSQGAADGDISVIIPIRNLWCTAIYDQRDRLRGNISIKVAVDDRVAHLLPDTDVVFRDRGESQFGSPVLLR